MKKKSILLGFFVGTLALTSCDHDHGTTVADEVSEAFVSMFPTASDLEWTKSGDYWMADFKVDGMSKEAFFDDAGEWYMTDTDIDKADLPTIISDAIKLTEWSDWTVSDVDELERSGIETVYIVELEKGDEEIELLFSSNGILLDIIVDKDDDDDHSDFIEAELLTSIETYLSENFAGAKILDRDEEDNGYEIDILYNDEKYELFFDLKGVWVSTSAELSEDNVPTMISEAIAASEYAGGEIDDIEYLKTTTEEYYLVEIEKNDKDYLLKISMDGTITLEENDDDDNDDDDDQ